jgi:hypothetical protein
MNSLGLTRRREVLTTFLDRGGKGCGKKAYESAKDELHLGVC